MITKKWLKENGFKCEFKPFSGGYEYGDIRVYVKNEEYVVTLEKHVKCTKRYIIKAYIEFTSDYSYNSFIDEVTGNGGFTDILAFAYVYERLTGKELYWLRDFRDKGE